MSEETKPSPYTKIYTLGNGEEIKVLPTYEGRYIDVLVGRSYKDQEHKHKDIPVPEQWQDPAIRKVERPATVLNEESRKLLKVVDTYIVAEDKNWVEYPTVDYYTTEASNSRATTKVEIVLQDEEWSRRIFKEWQGNQTLYDLLQNLEWELYDDFSAGGYGARKDGKEIVLDFYTQDGQTTELEITRSNISDRIVSARVVAFKTEVECWVKNNKSDVDCPACQYRHGDYYYVDGYCIKKEETNEPGTSNS